MRCFKTGKPFYQANVWGELCDLLLLEEFTTKREAVKCINDFVKKYKGKDKLDCYVLHFGKDGRSDYSFDVLEVQNGITW